MHYLDKRSFATTVGSNWTEGQKCKGGEEIVFSPEESGCDKRP